jgi:hypothetical protein
MCIGPRSSTGTSKLQGVARTTSTIKIGIDSTEVDALIEKLERATELASRLMPYFQTPVQARDYVNTVNVGAAEPDYSERDAAAQRDSDRAFFAESAEPFGEVVGAADGLTDVEREVSEYLVAAVNAFGQLDRRHPDELREFVDGIHACQHQLGWRIVQRAYPGAWPVKRPE